jgi:hypothetical protein
MHLARSISATNFFSPTVLIVIAPDGQSLMHILHPIHFSWQNRSLPRKSFGIGLFTNGYDEVAGFLKSDRSTWLVIFPGLNIIW